MIFDTKVAGIPCRCEVTYYLPDIPANLNGHPDNWTAPEGGEFEFNLLDRRGYRAVWLERKLTSQDNDRLYAEFKRHTEQQYFDTRLENYENRCF